jgi:hypothetical protein
MVLEIKPDESVYHWHYHPFMLSHRELDLAVEFYKKRLANSHMVIVHWYLSDEYSKGIHNEPENKELITAMRPQTEFLTTQDIGHIAEKTGIDPANSWHFVSGVNTPYCLTVWSYLIQTGRTPSFDEVNLDVNRLFLDGPITKPGSVYGVRDLIKARKPVSNYLHYKNIEPRTPVINLEDIVFL